jgi:adenine phosphoribosyltransferase
MLLVDLNGRSAGFKERKPVMSEPRGAYTVEVAGLTRDLPLFEVAPGLQIAVLNILGDTELVQACSHALADKLNKLTYDVLVTAEAKSIPLAYALSVDTHKPYVVLRKNYKPYMGVTLYAETLSITTGKPQVLYLDEKDHELIRGKQVILVDDVISTGSTLKGMRRVVEKAGAQVIGQAAIFTEGEPDDWEHITSLGHLPLFKDG